MLNRFFFSLDSYLQKITAHGLPAANSWLFTQLGLVIHLRGPTLPPGPVIIVGLNHEALIEPIAISHFIHRPPYALIGNYGLTHYVKVPGLIIPIVPQRFAIDRPLTPRRLGERFLDSYFRPLNRFIRLQKFTSTDITTINRQAFQQALGVLRKNGILMIFPTGAGAATRPWGKGLGEIIHRSLASGLSPQIVACRVTHVSKPLFLFRLLYFLFTHHSPPHSLHLTVSISPPRSLPPSWVRLSPHRITHHLKSSL